MLVNILCHKSFFWIYSPLDGVLLSYPASKSRGWYKEYNYWFWSTEYASKKKESTTDLKGLPLALLNIDEEGRPMT